MGFYPRSVETMIINPRTFAVSLAEEKLLRRLRQLRNSANICEVIITLKPLSLKSVGKNEILEIVDIDEAHP